MEKGGHILSRFQQLGHDDSWHCLGSVKDLCCSLVFPSDTQIHAHSDHCIPVCLFSFLPPALPPSPSLFLQTQRLVRIRQSQNSLLSELRQALGFCFSFWNSFFTKPRMTLNSWPSCLHLLSAEITGVCNHAHLHHILQWLFCLSLGREKALYIPYTQFLSLALEDQLLRNYHPHFILRKTGNKRLQMSCLWTP